MVWNFSDDVHFALRWKNFVHASPSFSQVSLEHCRLLERSTAASPSTLTFSAFLNCFSSSVSSRKSCASSRRKMISYAIWNCIWASPNKLLLQFLRALAVLQSLWWRMLRAEIPVTGASQAVLTTSKKPGTRVQNCSNLKVAGSGSCRICDRKRGQWSEADEDRACRWIAGNDRSHSLLQNTRSSRTKVGLFLSLLHVNFRFWRAISKSSQWSRACLNNLISRRFRFRLFLSCAEQGPV